jgi:hypothetical protein
MPLRVQLTLTAGQPTPPAGMAPTGTIHFSDSRANAFWTPQDPGIVASGSGWAVNTVGQFPAAGQDNVSASYAGNANFAAINNSTSPLQVGVPNADHNTRYIYWVYNDLLGRGPDTAGLNFWVGQLNGGVPRPAVATSLVYSNEYRGDVIAGMYQDFLNRGTDSGGLNYWVGRVAAGLTFEQFETMLIGSPEYYNMANKGKGNNTDFVKSMYEDVLGRSVDTGGLQYFTNLLNSGVPAATVVSIVVLSTENLRTTVDGYYQHFLSRNSDPAGRDYWVGQLQQGARDETIVSLIIGSNEYFSLV